MPELAEKIKAEVEAIKDQRAGEPEKIAEHTGYTENVLEETGVNLNTIMLIQKDQKVRKGHRGVQETIHEKGLRGAIRKMNPGLIPLEVGRMTKGVQETAITKTHQGAKAEAKEIKIKRFVSSI